MQIGALPAPLKRIELAKNFTRSRLTNNRRRFFRAARSLTYAVVNRA